MHPDDDPARTVAYINDNRARLKSRVAQLNTGVRHSQTPPSVMRRMISNLEVLGHEGDIVTVAGNFVLYEYRHALTPWAGRYVYRIRDTGAELELVAKTVHLVNGAGAIPTMSFLI
jgi:3-phenylpropionate/cinnamic acid dioxygenase small subunit